MKRWCDRPDIHLPELRCNQPMPCKYHGGERGRVAHFEDHVHRASPDPRWMKDPRLFGIRLGEQWKQVCAKFLHIYE
jgi:hypothetical protein